MIETSVCSGRLQRAARRWACPFEKPASGRRATRAKFPKNDHPPSTWMTKEMVGESDGAVKRGCGQRAAMPCAGLTAASRSWSFAFDQLSTFQGAPYPRRRVGDRTLAPASWLGPIAFLWRLQASLCLARQRVEGGGRQQVCVAREGVTGVFLARSFSTQFTTQQDLTRHNLTEWPSGVEVQKGPEIRPFFH